MAIEYRCIRDCWYQYRLWHAGDKATFDDRLEPPRHFKRLTPPPPPKPKVEVKKPKAKPKPPAKANRRT